ncbi:MAG: outer membrane beta-barrel protein [Chitinophagales bacterium]
MHRKDLHIFMLLFTMWFGAAQAQTEQGKMLGGGALAVSYFKQDTIHSFDISIQPTLGYFAFKNFMIGANLGIALTSDNRGKKGISRLIVTTSFTPAIRYYFLKGNLKPFIYASFGYYGSTTVTNGNTSATEGLTGSGGLGADYFFNRNFALEFALGYTGKRDTGKSLQSRFGVSIGTMLFFDPKIKNTYRKILEEE